MFLLVLLYGVMFVKCLLKAFALSMSVMAVLVLKQIFLFYSVGGLLLDSFAMVPHSECGLCL